MHIIDAQVFLPLNSIMVNFKSIFDQEDNPNGLNQEQVHNNNLSEEEILSKKFLCP